MECRCGLGFINSSGFKQHVAHCRLEPGATKQIVSDYVGGLVRREIAEKYGICSALITKILLGVARTSGESAKLTKHRRPKKVFSEETKERMRVSHIAYLKANPEKTAWRIATISYPEQVFKAKIESLGLDKEYLIVREKSVHPYYIDFAFENEKVAVEIDGSQHELPERKAKDEEKDKKLIELGWRVYRVRAAQVQQNIDHVISDVLKFIGAPDSTKKCGLVLDSDLRKVAQANERARKGAEKAVNGITEKELESKILLRRAPRPSHDELIKQTQELGFLATGRLHGVSDNSIRKWLKMYEKHGR